MYKHTVKTNKSYQAQAGSSTGINKQYYPVSNGTRHAFNREDSNFNKPLFKNFTSNNVQNYHKQHIAPFTRIEHPQKQYSSNRSQYIDPAHEERPRGNTYSAEHSELGHAEEPLSYPTATPESGASPETSAGLAYAGSQAIHGIAESTRLATQALPGVVSHESTELNVAHPETPAPNPGFINAREKEANKDAQTANTAETIGSVVTTVGGLALSVL